MIKKIRAFTIAEIVVAMLVLGGIAMILMPILFHNAQEQINDTALNKTYSIFQQTSRSVGLLISKGQIADSGNSADTFFQALRQTAKTIDKSNDVAYFEDYTTDIGTDVDGKQIFSSQAGVAANAVDTVVLKNGVFVSCKTYAGIDYIVVDINGLRVPNKVGKDIFFFEVKNVNNTYSVHPARGNCNENEPWDERIGCTKDKLKLVR